MLSHAAKRHPLKGASMSERAAMARQIAAKEEKLQKEIEEL